MGSAESLTGKTPAQTCKDLFHINNSNNGIDDTERTLYGGNGEATPISLSKTKVSISCGEGLINKPQIKNARWTWLEHNSVNGTNYTVSFLGGNIHKINLSGDLTNLVISDAPDSATESFAGELTLLIDAQNTYEITNWPSTTLWSNGVKPDFAKQANDGLLLVRLLTLDGGTTWYGQILGENLRSAP